MFYKTEELPIFPKMLNRLVTTTKDDKIVCLVLERARGIDLVQFNKLLAPKLRWEPDKNVYKYQK
jgi:hypothetical protein